VIFETISILGGALALIAVQPPLRRIFPEKPKQTVWEEYWEEAAARHKHWDSCGMECDSHSSDIADHVRAATKPKVGTIAAAHHTLKTRYVPQIKEQLTAAGDIMQRVITERQEEQAARERTKAAVKGQVAPYERAETDIEAVNAAVARGANLVFLPEQTQWIDLLPAKVDQPRAEPRKDMTWRDRDHEINQRQKVTKEAQRLGKQVYLDHATNEYRMRDRFGESQLAANERALRDGLNNSLRQQMDAECARLGVDLTGYQQALQQASLGNYWLPDQPLSTAARGTAPVSSANEDMLRALGVWKDEDGTTLRQL
jgi:hypothetical protein